MTFADKYTVLARRRGQNVAPAASDNRLRAALLPRSGTLQPARHALPLIGPLDHTAVLLHKS